MVLSDFMYYTFIDIVTHSILICGQTELGYSILLHWSKPLVKNDGENLIRMDLFLGFMCVAM